MIKVEHWDPAWGPADEPNMRQRLEKEGYQVFLENYPPGTDLGKHTHAIVRKDAVLSGRLRVGTPEGEFILGPGDAIEIPIDLLHSAAVDGEEPVVSLAGWRKPR